MVHSTEAIASDFPRRDADLPRREASVRYRSTNRLKRATDVLGALIGLVLLSPIFLALVLLIRSGDGGTAFYRHKRIGRDGREFGCLKFRTMVLDGDAALDRHLAANPAAREEWLATRKLKDDPRVTPVGTVLRKLSLDELPQLWNVLVGEMSLVGPRPVVKAELDYYGAHLPIYLLSRPGMTGLWQVSGRNDVSYEARVAFDRHYVENWSFGSDILIIVKTIPAVCLSRGTY